MFLKKRPYADRPAPVVYNKGNIINIKIPYKLQKIFGVVHAYHFVRSLVRKAKADVVHCDNS